MKFLNTTIKGATAISLVFLLTGCGGGGGGDSGSSNTVEPEPSLVSGGPPSTPTFLSLTEMNVINNNPYYNYFKYSASKNEKLIIRSSLTIPLSDLQNSRCSSNPGTDVTPSSYDTQIHVYDQNFDRIAGTCGESLTFVAPDDGVYIFHFEYPSNGSGIFNAASIQGDSAITSPSGPTGNPGAPRILLTASSNIIFSEEFYNYYRFSMDVGDKLIINVQLDSPLSTEQKTRCASSLGRGDTPSGYKTQIHVYTSLFERVDGICGEALTFEAPAPGVYIFHFAFGAQSSGFVYADEIKKQ